MHHISGPFYANLYHQIHFIMILEIVKCKTIAQGVSKPVVAMVEQESLGFF